MRRKRLSNLKWKTVHIGSGKNRRYIKIAMQKHTGRTVTGKPRRTK